MIIDVQECIMHPVLRKNLPVAALTLGNLILVMRKDQILPARMNVYFLSQILSGHDRAFNMPAGTALAPW